VIKITTLSENSATGKCIGEWGLSVLVETDDAKVLFDTARSFTAVLNAQTLGVDLAGVDMLVLSHGHYDHTGGLKDLLVHGGDIEIIAHPDIWAPKYKRPKNKKPEYIGIPYSKDELENIGADFKLTTEPVEISASLMTTGEIPKVNDFEAIESLLREKKGDDYILDEMRDDQALIVKSDAGLIIILGCAHRGVINTLNYAQKITGESRINAIIGGLHLIRSSAEYIERTISELEKFDIKMVAASHCTGFEACCRLHQVFGDRFMLNNAGTTITLPV